jgi:hypothetical protein
MEIDGGSYMAFFSGGSAPAARFPGQGLVSQAFGPVAAAMSQFRPSGDPTGIALVISGTVIRHELRRGRTANSRSNKWL